MCPGNDQPSSSSSGNPCCGKLCCLTQGRLQTPDIMPRIALLKPCLFFCSIVKERYPDRVVALLELAADVLDYGATVCLQIGCKPGTRVVFETWGVRVQLPRTNSSWSGYRFDASLRGCKLGVPEIFLWYPWMRKSFPTYAEGREETVAAAAMPQIQLGHLEAISRNAERTFSPLLLLLTNNMGTTRGTFKMGTAESRKVASFGEKAILCILCAARHVTSPQRVVVRGVVAKIGLKYNCDALSSSGPGMIPSAAFALDSTKRCDNGLD